jgi:uncharacterized protein (DUF983 family)
MPPRVVRCRTCGALLNRDLDARPIEAPQFVMLPEVHLVIDTTTRGYYIACPNCEQELRIAAKYVGQNVQCEHCTAPFRFDRVNPSIRKLGFYADCPHCKQELRAADKYLGRKVSCKLCNGGIRFVDPGRETE